MATLFKTERQCHTWWNYTMQEAQSHRLYRLLWHCTLGNDELFLSRFRRFFIYFCMFFLHFKTSFLKCSPTFVYMFTFRFLRLRAVVGALKPHCPAQCELLLLHVIAGCWSKIEWRYRVAPPNETRDTDRADAARALISTDAHDGRFADDAIAEGFVSATHTHTHTHTFNGPFSRTTQVSRYEKGKTNLAEARDSEWQ